MPAALVRVSAEALNAIEPEMVGRQCQLWDYTAIPVPALQLDTDFIAYSSPDSTYAVTKKFFDDATKSILIGIYDFTATYVSELLLQAMRRGVKVSLMLDLDNRNGETDLYQNLVDHGCDGVPSPSCATQNDAAYFASSHEKVIVIDDEWVLVQSGNYSDNSIPLNEKDGGDPDHFNPGNRDMGVAVRSKDLATFFTTVLRSDMKLELSGAPAAEALSESMLGQAVEAVFEAAPPEPPRDLFPSKPFNPKKAVTVQPILSPDNYMLEIPKWLRTAKKSVYIEQQYIRGDQDKIGECMKAIVDARDSSPDLDIRIILAKPFPGKRFDKEAQKIKDLNKLYGVKVGPQVRILSPKHFVHCHNKLIIVDDQAVLISSQNWSDAALVKNREAGLLLDYPDMAKHYSKIFESDWETAEKTLKKKAKAEFFGPESLGTGKTVPISPGDYVIFGDDQDFPPDKRRPAGATGKAKPQRKKTTRAKGRAKSTGRKRKAGATTRRTRSAAQP